MELIPKLSQNEMAPELAAMLGPRVERLGYLGEFFRYTAHQPNALMSFLRFTEDLKKALPDNLTEIVALTVAKEMNNAYERVQHERLSLRLGLGEPWVRTVLATKAEANGILSEAESLVQKLTLAVLARKGHDTQPQLEAVVRAVGHQQAIAVLMLIGRYTTHALIVNSLNLAPPVPSPLGEA
jgi:alkylhydroperoxidase family enzyme